MKLFTYILLILSISLVSCKTKKKAADAIQDEVVKVEKPVIKYNDNDLVASIQKGMCFGKCPVYKAEIYGNGRVVFIGERNVANIGTFQAEISQDKLQEIVLKAKAFDYTSLNDEYDNKYVTDLPTTNTYMFIDGKKKAIKSRYGSPAELTSFEKYLHEVIMGLSYVIVLDK